MEMRVGRTTRRRNDGEMREDGNGGKWGQNGGIGGLDEKLWN